MRRWLPALMLGVLAGCGQSEAPDDVVNPVQAHEAAQVVPAREALSGANIPTLDPATMDDAEIREVIGQGPHCAFRYTSSGKPVLAVSGGGEGVVKLNGYLVALQASSAEGEFVLGDGDVRLSLSPDDPAPGGEQVEASVIFQVGDTLRVGYRGYYRCAD